MTYADKRYISVARKNELYHHDREMDQLRIKIEQLSRLVAWELKQHQDRIQELQTLEDTLNTGDQKKAAPVRLTLKPISEAEREQRIQREKGETKRKRNHRASQDESTELVS